MTRTTVCVDMTPRKGKNFYSEKRSRTKNTDMHRDARRLNVFSVFKIVSSSFAAKTWPARRLYGADWSPDRKSKDLDLIIHDGGINQIKFLPFIFRQSVGKFDLHIL